MGSKVAVWVSVNLYEPLERLGVGRWLPLPERAWRLLGALDAAYELATRSLRRPVRFFAAGYGDVGRAEAAWAALAAASGAVVPAAPPGAALEPSGFGDAPPGVETLRFASPAAAFLPRGVAETAAEVMRPPGGEAPRAWVVLLPGTGDQECEYRRELVARPLLRRGVGAVIPHVPFAGSRRPCYQLTRLHSKVADFGLAVAAMSWEAAALARWLQERDPGTPVLLSGVSLGASAAACAALAVGGGVGVVPFLGTGKGETFLDGVLRHRCDWDTLHAEIGSADRAKAEEPIYDMLRWLSHKPLAEAARARGSTHPLGVVNQVNCRADRFVLPAHGEALFGVLATLAPPGKSRFTWWEGGHVSGVVLRTHAYAGVIDEAIELLQGRSGEHADSLVPP